jgi:Flp pilus assembly protein TadG
MKQHMKMSLHKSRRGERGLQMAEFALVAPATIFLLLGIMDSGRAILAYTNMAHTAREATRYAIVRGADSGRAATATDIENYAVSRAGVTPIQVTSTWTPDNKSGSVVRVEIRHAFNPATPLLPNFTLASTSRMVIY